jgi:hypothetical protein
MRRTAGAVAATMLLRCVRQRGLPARLQLRGQVAGPGCGWGEWLEALLVKLSRACQQCRRGAGAAAAWQSGGSRGSQQSQKSRGLQR